ncbi:hypothetical protein ACFLT2_03380 [Acidobacteriota bacterium]
MKALIIALTITILIVVYPASILALDADNDSYQKRRRYPKQRRWSVSVYLGSASSGPAEDLEKAMIAAGLDHRFVWYWAGAGPFYSDPYPSSSTKTTLYRLPWMIRIHYLVKPPFGVGLVYSNTEIGDTAGYNEKTSRFDVEYSVNTISPVVSVQAIGFQFGVGPALYMANSIGKRLSLEESLGEKKTSKIGFLIDFGFAIPTGKTRFFVEFKAQFRAVEQVKVGPYEIKVDNDFFIFPETKVNYNHWFIGGGIGVRF